MQIKARIIIPENDLLDQLFVEEVILHSSDFSLVAIIHNKKMKQIIVDIKSND